MTSRPGAPDPNSLDPNGGTLAQRGIESGLRPTAPVPRWAEFVARLLDDAVAIPGTRIRIGLDGIVGMFLPGAGDAVTAVGSAALLLLAIRRRVPTTVLMRMLLNIALDVCAGAVPVVGDLFDFAHKSNRKNLELIKGERGGVATRGRLGDAVLLAVGFFLLMLCVLLPLIVWFLILRVIEH